jgi:hypothetical protein
VNLPHKGAEADTGNELYAAIVEWRKRGRRKRERGHGEKKDRKKRTINKISE